MPNFNQIIVRGHLGKDPELRHFNSGDAVANASVAYTEKWKDKSGEMKEETTWFAVEVFGRDAEYLVKYAKKGSDVQFVGRMKCKKDDSGKEWWKLRADKVFISQSDSVKKTVETKPSKKPQVEEEDIPF